MWNRVSFYLIVAAGAIWTASCNPKVSQRYPDLNIGPQTHEQAMAMGAKPIERTADFSPAPGSISIALSDEARSQRFCERCYIGPCERDTNNKVTGFREFGYWIDYERSRIPGHGECIPQPGRPCPPPPLNLRDADDAAIVSEGLKTSGHALTAEDVANIRGNVGFTCKHFRLFVPKECVPGST
jgi:hypothetical protein